MKTAKTYWFKRRRYGYGWIPVTKEGWSILLSGIAIVVVSAFLILPAKPTTPSVLQLTIFFLITLSVIMMFIGVCLAKGPSPHWRWGKKTDNPEEDF